MVDAPQFPKRPPLPPVTSEPSGPGGDFAEAADIRRPSQQVIQEEEAAAQFQKRVKADPGTLPRTLAEAAAIQKELERRGKRVERNTESLMKFLKRGKGDNLSADVLVATAALMASIPMKRKQKKKHLMELYFRWAREKTTVLITKVIDTFRHKK